MKYVKKLCSRVSRRIIRFTRILPAIFRICRILQNSCRTVPGVFDDGIFFFWCSLAPDASYTVGGQAETKKQCVIYVQL